MESSRSSTFSSRTRSFSAPRQADGRTSGAFHGSGANGRPSFSRKTSVVSFQVSQTRGPGAVIGFAGSGSPRRPGRAGQSRAMRTCQENRSDARWRR